LRIFKKQITIPIKLNNYQNKVINQPKQPGQNLEQPKSSDDVLRELEEAIASPQEEGEDSYSTQEIPLVWINKVLFDLVMLPKGKGLQILEQLNTQGVFFRQYLDRSSEQGPFLTTLLTNIRWSQDFQEFMIRLTERPSREATLQIFAEDRPRDKIRLLKIIYEKLVEWHKAYRAEQIYTSPKKKEEPSIESIQTSDHESLRAVAHLVQEQFYRLEEGQIVQMEHTYLLPSVARNVARYLKDDIFVVDLSDPTELQNLVLDLSFPKRIGNQKRNYLFYGWPFIDPMSSDRYDLTLALKRALPHTIINLDSPGSPFYVEGKQLTEVSIGGIEIHSDEMKNSIKQDILNIVKISFQNPPTIKETSFLGIIKQIIDGIVSGKEKITDIASLRQKVVSFFPNESPVYTSLLTLIINGYILGQNYTVPPLMREIFG
jgi:hypothetical protein